MPEYYTTTTSWDAFDYSINTSDNIFQYVFIAPTAETTIPIKKEKKTTQYQKFVRTFLNKKGE